jgi:hypothetical protein
MSVTYITAELRRFVIARAEGICEYCLIAAEDTYLGCQVNHIISEKHGGPTDADNLAYACVFCNRAKGSDIGSTHWESGHFARFYNPRIDRWDEHFNLSGSKIDGLTQIGAVTALILEMNHPNRILEHRTLREDNRYPNPAALRRMRTAE